MTCNFFFLFFCLFTFYELSERPTSQLRKSFNHQKFRNVQKLCHAVNILDAFDIYEDCSLQSIRSMDLFDLFPCYLHHIATRDQGQGPVGHQTKRGPNLILLRLQQITVVCSTEKNLSVSVSSHLCHSQTVFS